MIALWVATYYLIRNNKKLITSLLTAIPATFMSAVSTTYILVANEGLHLDTRIGYPIGLTAAVILFMVYMVIVIRTARRNA